MREGTHYKQQLNPSSRGNESYEKVLFTAVEIVQRNCFRK
jgi:hypothetical protein